MPLPLVVGSNPGSSGGGAVTSVAGRTGAVVLTGADVGAGQLPAGVLLPSGVAIPSNASATTQAANDNSTKVATTAYADAIAALKLSLTGGTMSGAIAMGTSKITGLGDPTADQDTMTKHYHDNAPGRVQFNGLLGQSLSVDAGAMSASGALVSGTKYVMRLKVEKEAASGTRTVALGVSTAGVGLTSAQNLISVYNSSGTQLGSTSADQTTPWASVGAKTATVGTFALAVGDTIYIEALSVFVTTAPQFLGAGLTGAGAMNVNLSGATLRCATNGTGATAVDASITPGSLSTSNIKAFWIGIY